MALPLAAGDQVPIGLKRLSWIAANVPNVVLSQKTHLFNFLPSFPVD
jgi:hypothetical protein